MCCNSWGRKESDTTEWLIWSALICALDLLVNITTKFYLICQVENCAFKNIYFIHATNSTCILECLNILYSFVFKFLLEYSCFICCISFRCTAQWISYIYVLCCAVLCSALLSYFSHVWFSVTLWTVSCQASLYMGFPRQEYQMGCHICLQGIFPTQGLIYRYIYSFCFFLIFFPFRSPQGIE